MSISKAIASETGIIESEFNKLVGLEEKKQILNTLKKDRRVEIIPTKNGIRVLEVTRKQAK